MPNGAKGSSSAERRRRRRFVGAAVTVLAAGLIASGMVSLARPDGCSGAACAPVGWSPLLAIGVLAIVVGGAVVVVALARVSGWRKGARRGDRGTIRHDGGGDERVTGWGVPPAQAASGSRDRGAILERSAPTAIEPMPRPVDRRDGRHGGAVPEGDRADGDMICPALADWIARARRGGEGGARP